MNALWDRLDLSISLFNRITGNKLKGYAYQTHSRYQLRENDFERRLNFAH